MPTFDNIRFNANQKKQDEQINLSQNPFWNPNLLNQQVGVPREGYQQQEQIMSIPIANGMGGYGQYDRPLSTIDRYDNVSQDDSKYALTAEGQKMVDNQKDLSATQSPINGRYNTNTQNNLLNALSGINYSGGIGAGQAAFMSGQGFAAAANARKQGDTRTAGIGTAQGVLGALATSMDVGKNVLAGIGQQKRNDYQTQRMQDNMRLAAMNGTDGQEALHSQGYMQNSFYGQDGGGFTQNPMKRTYDNSMPKKNQELLSVMSGRTMPEVENGNSEIEEGENVNQNGEVLKAEGEKHKEGGTDVNLEQGDRVLTDDIRIPSELRSKLSDEIGVEVTHKNTFSEILDKYKKKIGIIKLQEEQEQVFADLKKYNEKDYKNLRQTETTKKVNEQLISTKINDLQKEIDALKPQLAETFDKIYDAQEYAKIELSEKLRRKDGKRMADEKEEFEEGQEYVYRDGGKEIKMMYKDGGFHTKNDDDYNNLLNVLKTNNVKSDKDINKFFAKCGGMKKYQDGGQEGAQEQMQQIAQALQQGADPQEIIQILMQQGLDQNQASEMVQGIMQQIAPQQQQAPQQMQEQTYRDGGLLKLQDGGQQGQMEQVVMQIAQQIAQDVQPQEIFQQLVQGGMDENSATQLIQQASQIAQQMYEQEQAQAQATTQEGEQAVMRNGGKQMFQNGTDGDGFKFAREYGEKKAGDVEQLLKSIKENKLLEAGDNTPPYGYKEDFEKAKQRLIEAHNSWGVSIGDLEKAKNFKDLDNAANTYQQTLLKKNPELITEYSKEALSTRQGVDALISEGVIKKGDNVYKELEKEGIIVNGSANKGVADTKGVYKLLSEHLQKTDPTKLQAYAEKNFPDGMWNYRTPVRQEHYFPTKEDLNAFVSKPPEGIEVINKDGRTYAKQKGTNVFTELGYYQTKDLESEDEYKKLKLGETDDAGYEIGKDGNFGVRTAYRYKGQPIEEQPIGGFTPQQTSTQNMHFVAPKMELPPDTLQAPAFAMQDFRKTSPIKQAYHFQPIIDQRVATGNMLAQNVGAQQNANALQSQAIYSKAIEGETANTDAQNAQYALQANQVNLQQDNTQQNANVQGLLGYDQKQAIASANQSQSIRNYFDAIHANNTLARQETRELNLIDGINQNYTFDELGRVKFVNTGDKPVQYDNKLVMALVDNARGGNKKTSAELTTEQKAQMFDYLQSTMKS